MIIAKVAGLPIPKVDKRAAESIVYRIDCSELLDTNEVITIIELPENTDSSFYSEVRSRLGKHIEVRVDNAPISTAQYIDNTVNIFFLTNFKNKKLVTFTLRIHK